MADERGVRDHQLDGDELRPGSKARGDADPTHQRVGGGAVVQDGLEGEEYAGEAHHAVAVVRAVEVQQVRQHAGCENKEGLGGDGEGGNEGGKASGAEGSLELEPLPEKRDGVEDEVSVIRVREGREDETPQAAGLRGGDGGRQGTGVAREN